MPKKLCTNCDKVANKSCDRCGDFYCSRKCQIENWSMHRYICFPLPRLMIVSDETDERNNPETVEHVQDSNISSTACEVAAPSLLLSRLSVHDPSTEADLPSNEISNDFNAQSSLNTIVIPNGAEVKIVNIIDHKTIKVQLNLSSQYRNIVKRIAKEAIDAPPLGRIPRIDELVLSFSSNRMKFGRARVLDVDNGEFKCDFIDFGFVENKQLDQLKVITESIRELEVLVNEIECDDTKIFELFDIHCREQTIFKLEYEQNDVFKYNFGVKIRGKLIKKHSSLSKSETSVGSQSSIRKYPSFVSLSSKATNRTDTTEIAHKGFSGENVEVLILDNSMICYGFFTCIASAEGPTFHSNDEQINQFGKILENDEPFRPKEGDYCLVQMSNEKLWFRASCLSHEENDAFKVIFIDYGTMEKVYLSQIRKLPDDLEFPCISVNCYVNGVANVGEIKPVKTDLIKKLKKFFQCYGKIILDEVVYDAEKCAALCRSDDFAKSMKI